MYITKHAKKRLKQRVGLHKKASGRIAEKVLNEGLPHKETTGNLKKWVSNAYLRYGGAAAEEIFLGSIHGGSLGSDTSDFVVAQQFIKNSLILNIERKNKVGLTEGFLSEMEKKSEELYQKAYFIIKENQDVVKRLAEKLEEKERLTEHEIKELIQENVIESV